MKMRCPLGKLVDPGCSVIRTTWLQQDSVESFGWKRDTRWLYYDREGFEIYERRGAWDGLGRGGSAARGWR